MTSAEIRRREIREYEQGLGGDGRDEMTQPIVGQRYSFPNGWSIDVHEIRNGEVYFRRWGPGVETQGFLDNLRQCSRRARMGEFFQDKRIKELRRAEELLDKILDAYDKYCRSQHRIDYDLFIGKIESAERERSNA